MSIRPRYPHIPSSQITPEPVWQARRQWMQHMAGIAAGTGLAGLGATLPQVAGAANTLPAIAGMQPNPQYAAAKIDRKLTTEKDITSYNNFYEFGTGKGDPLDYSGKMRTEPWQVQISGEVEKPRTFDLDELVKLAPQEERVYRLRCVEAWSMVIPWVGYPLSALLKQVQPTSKAKFVQFVTDTQPEAMPGLSDRIIPWPYREGLRMDEAMNPLTLLTFGLYGKRLPNQNGAPLRIIVPWKYGFKSGKSIVKIVLSETMPETSWVAIAPSEYGFYANVNPDVPHPRWSQSHERVIGGGFFDPKVPTLKFNGYAEQVASLYSGMDLRANY